MFNHKNDFAILDQMNATSFKKNKKEGLQTKLWYILEKKAEQIYFF